MRDLFIETKPQATKARIIAEYGYIDESSKLLFQVVRLDPKGFRQRRPDGNASWTWNLHGARRVLYCLPEVLAAKSCSLSRARNGTSPEAESGHLQSRRRGNWRDDYPESLRGKKIAIITDADEPGRKHAQHVAQSLHSKTDPQVLELPGAKDLTEWVERGGTREAFLELIRSATVWKPAGVVEAGKVTPQSGFRLTSLHDLMLEPEEHISWLLADKLPAGGLSVLSAKPKVGKSTFARCLALAVATGEPFLDCATAQGPVIYLALEEKRSEVRRHFADLGATGEEEIYVHAASAPQEAVLELCQVTRQKLPVLVVIDPLFKFVRIRDEKA